MSEKPKIASVRPSPLASIMGIVFMIAILILGISFMSDIPEGGSLFMLVWVLVGLAGIGYFIANLLSFSGSPAKSIPLTAEDVIEVAADDQEPSVDFETKLRKIEALKKDGLLSEEEYRQKRKEIINQKW